MTEQEAAAMAARLTRIWQPVIVSRCRLDRDGKSDWYAYLQGSARRREIALYVSFYTDPIERPDLVLLFNWGQDVVARLSVSDDGYVEQCTWKASKVMRREYVQRSFTYWTPLFARNCWLSGFDMEASAHEKAEWMQGFSREEIDAWNLKI